MKHIAGIIGFGGMAGHHANSMKQYSRLAFKGIYDVNPDRGTAAKKLGLMVYPSQEALLADEEIEIVLIATTNEVHKEIATAAMKAGKHVICEKPVTISSEELQEIIDASEKYQKIFTIDQNRRTNPDFLRMKEYVENGTIGKPYHIESRVEGSRGMPTGWRTLKALGGGMMLDWGVHLIDQLMFMIPEPIISVHCKMYKLQYPEVDDNFRLTLTFGNGLTAQIEVSTNNYITHPRWYVLGEKGTLQIDDWGCTGKIVRCIDKEDQWGEEIVYTKAGPTKTMAPRNPGSTQVIELEEYTEKYHDMIPVYDQLLDAVEGKAPLKITAQQAMRVMKVMEAAFESDQTGQVVLCNI